MLSFSKATPVFILQSSSFLNGNYWKEVIHKCVCWDLLSYQLVGLHFPCNPVQKWSCNFHYTIQSKSLSKSLVVSSPGILFTAFYQKRFFGRCSLFIRAHLTDKTATKTAARCPLKVAFCWFAQGDMKNAWQDCPALHFVKGDVPVCRRQDGIWVELSIAYSPGREFSSMLSKLYLVFCGTACCIRVKFSVKTDIQISTVDENKEWG